MDILTDSELRPGLFAASAVTVGNFDGVHLGHRALIARVVERARAHGGPGVVYTFDPHPLRVLHPAACPPMLCDFAEKAERVAALGADVMVRVRFDRAYAERPPEWFAETVLANCLGAAEVWVGPDFRFGRGRGGDVALLESVGMRRGYAVASHPPVLLDGERVSSTRVRQAVREADFDLAGRLLGRPYALLGVVAHGAGRGHGLGFPTANLAARQECLPPDGVYAARIRWKGSPWRPAAVNVGDNPTFGAGERLVEAHVMDYDGALYGERVELRFVRRVRGEIAFASVEALVSRIGEDIAEVRAILAADAPPEARA